jgi:phage host-nuclease inhibitor protein Gam
MKIKNPDQAADAVARRAELERAMLKETADAAVMEASVKSAYKERMEPLEKEAGEIESALLAWAESKKKELFGERKSLDFPAGTIGYRKSTAVTPVDGMNWPDILIRLKAHGFGAAVSVKESVNKAVLSNMEKTDLEKLGVKKEVSERFYVKVA